MKRPLAVGFDWDNTLVDTFSLIVEANNFVRRELGYPEWTADDVRRQSSGALRETYPKLYGEKWETARDLYYQHYNSANKTQLRPLSGAAELLKKLQAEKIPLFIVSSKRGEILREEINALGWGCYFASIIGSMDVEKDKPDRIAFEKATAPLRLSLNNLDVWYIGDTEVDVEMARNAGCTSVIVGPIDRAKAWNADLYFSDCHKLANLLYTD